MNRKGGEPRPPKGTARGTTHDQAQVTSSRRLTPLPPRALRAFDDLLALVAGRPERLELVGWFAARLGFDRLGELMRGRAWLGIGLDPAPLAEGASVARFGGKPAAWAYVAQDLRDEIGETVGAIRDALEGRPLSARALLDAEERTL